jgi:hypothetical protein
MVLSAMIRRISVLLMCSLLQTPIAEPYMQLISDLKRKMDPAQNLTPPLT